MSAPAFPVADAGVRSISAKAAIPEFELVRAAMRTLASLKLTVALFAFGILIIYIGTVAQQQADIWQVVRDYFHAWIMWVDVNLLFPRAFFPFMPHLSFPLIPAPGGFTIGLLMAVNLLAAHGWRFTVQTRGMRLSLGLVVIIVGLLVGAIIVWSGHNSSGFQSKPPFAWETFWAYFLTGAGLLWGVAVAAYGYFGVLSLLRKINTQAIPGIEMVLLVLLAVPLLATGVLIGWGTFGSVRPSNEALRVVWQLVQGGLAGLILLVGCIMVFRKRGGMVLLHAGVGLLMFNELWVAMTARERQVFMQEGQTVNYLRDIRTVELAFVDRSGEKTDDQVVIPRDMLVANYNANRPLVKEGKPPQFIDDSRLPAKVAVVAYYRNSDVEDLKPGANTLATVGRGLKEALVERTAGKGTDTEGAVDLAGAYVQFADKSGQDLGTFLLSQLASEQKSPERFAEKLTVGDKTYDLFLRFKREYKPYTLRLVDVRKDDYLASDTPRNYSSDVRIVDPSAGVDENVHIKMNDPLRYRGDTLYQSGYHKLPDGEATTLQVVLNRGWMIPYVACMVVAIGMIAHFLITVTRFVGRREAEELASGEVVVFAELADADASLSRTKAKRARRNPSQRGVNWSNLGLPLLAAGIVVLWLGSALREPQAKPQQMDLARFGRLPVAHQGRVKPLDTLARNTLRAISLYETLKTDDGKRLPATQWLLDVVTARQDKNGETIADSYKIFRIDHPDLLKSLGLAHRPGFRYSIAEIKERIDRLLPQAESARKVASDERTVEQKRLLELEDRLRMYMLLVESFGPPRGMPRFPDDESLAGNPQAVQSYVAEMVAPLRGAAVELRRVNAVMPIPVADAAKQSENWKLLTKLLRGVGVPLSGGDAESPQDAWELYPTALALAAMQSRVGGMPGELPIAMYEEMKSAYREQDAGAFNRAVSQYESYLAHSPPPLWNARKVSLEAYRNAVSPYYLGLQVYVLAFLAAIFGWLFRYRPLNWAAFAIVLLTFVLHTAAIVLNIYVSGRPPVTNLHSAAVFIGWAAVIFGLVIEAIYRLGLGNIVASVAGFATLLIAYLLSAGGDTITVLQAVLDTQIWLATHVVCITLGYAATYVSGLFGLIYVLAGVCTRRLDEQARKELARMIYGVTCFAILFSFVGTVLGGLWADDSWGRFWGWDPKENGALIIVLWNALILHARWDKLVGDRGLALLAIGGNIVTSWSFFGVNQLGIGLHSYGFTNGVVEALDVFVLYMLAYVGFGLIPQRLWRSTATAGAGGARWNNPQLTFVLSLAFALVNAGFAAKLAQLAYKALA